MLRQWHRTESPEEGCFCALNMAQRWSYAFLQSLPLVDKLKIKIVEGRHCLVRNTASGQLLSSSKRGKKVSRVVALLMRLDNFMITFSLLDIISLLNHVYIMYVRRVI